MEGALAAAEAETWPTPEQFEELKDALPKTNVDFADWVAGKVRAYVRWFDRFAWSNWSLAVIATALWAFVLIEYPPF